LSVPELVAVLLNSGTKKEDVLSMSSRILKEYGERTLAGYTDPKRMARDLDIPMGKAMQMVACAELGRRFFEKRGQATTTIRTAKDVYDHVQDMHNLPKEHLRGLYLNVHHRLVHDEVLSIGTLTSNVIHPREVFKPALEFNAAALILVHNHPSGEVTPSAADVEVTKQIIEAGRIMGITVLDHIVVARDRYTSINSYLK
jgi:DNA repair protein RadC